MGDSPGKTLDPERLRLADGNAWKRWGPYLSERQWGTVREDYSADGDAWEYFPFEHSRSRAYRWGEDGIGGYCDEQARLCLSLALWNGRDSCLKERLFGLTNAQGNHGEDVKELYYYLDATPTHSYMRMLYKYAHAEFPYDRLVQENARRGKHEREFDLIDTGIFDDDRYFDVSIEFARAEVDDVLVRITAHNRGAEAAELHLLPHIWFRNTWSWGGRPERPSLRAMAPGVIDVAHADFAPLVFELDGAPVMHFCDNETNRKLLYGDDARVADGAAYFKDGINRCVVDGDIDAVNPSMRGTKAAGHYHTTVGPDQSMVVRARLRPGSRESGFALFNEVFSARQAEANEFYARLQREIESDDACLVQRQALAGMIWSKQFYYYDVNQWLKGDPGQPAPPESRKRGRNANWEHLNNGDIVSMPDKWEYPWYAAWDLVFHCLPLALVDVEFAKAQIELLTREWYMHPSGQLPAYEWQFGDVNPPVHAWATLRVYQVDRKICGSDGQGDRKFLERVFHKLLINFTWWVNRKDRDGNNVFQGGFLGLDNIGLFDRSKPLPTGGHIDQADGTAWMAMYSLNMMRIALELAQHNDVYEDIATKFFEHFLNIAAAMGKFGDGGLWDEDDEFFYDWLDLSGEDAERIPLRVRSMVGLIPLFAVEVLEPELLHKLPNFRKRLEWFLEYRPDLCKLISHWEVPGVGERRLLSLLRGHRMKCLLRRMLDETEFLSPYGVRALSRLHLEEPFRFEHAGQTHEVRYTPGESDSYLFGGNSNWRGPVWMPVNYLLIESLQRFHHYYGDDFLVECPTGSGTMRTIAQIADELSTRLTRLFLRDGSGRRPVLGDNDKFQRDPNFCDYVLFSEYFHGDNGRGLGAAHQTGWTGLVAKLLQPPGSLYRL